MSKLRVRFLSVFFFILFTLFEYIFNARIEAFHPYALFVVESLWVLGVLISFKNFKWFNLKKMVRLISMVLITGLLGAFVQFYAHLNQILIPFDFENKETLLLLLVVGPVVEEFLFRLGLWKVFEVFIPYKWILILITASLFSYSHYRVIGDLPNEVHSFVLFQTVYTFVLGMLCGLIRFNYGMVFSVLAHALFNLTFYWTR